MRFTWLSNAPWAPTGYGNQSKIFLPRFVDDLGHEVAVISFYGLEGGVLNWDGIQCYPRGFDPYGNDVITAHTAHWKARMCISLMDTWVVNPDMINEDLIKWVPYFPIDMEPLPKPVRNHVSRAWKRIVFSKFGERMMEEAGLDSYYVPHAVDTEAFKPIDRGQAREWLDFPEDAFVVGMVAANKGNPSRKAFPANLKAFAMLKENHSDVMLYLHTSKSEYGEHDGVNLPEYCEILGLEVGKDVIFCDAYNYLLGYNDIYMRALYNAMDVHLLVSMGEGFGIPIVEAQACGTPVIVGDWTSMSELCFSGWKVPKSEAIEWYTPLAASQYLPKAEAIHEQLENAYRMWGNMDYRERARKGALKYDADRVTEKYWKPVLEELEGLLEEEFEDVESPEAHIAGSGGPKKSQGFRMQEGDSGPSKSSDLFEGSIDKDGEQNKEEDDKENV